MKVFQKLENETNDFEMIDDFGNKVFSITKKYSLEVIFPGYKFLLILFWETQLFVLLINP